MLVTDMCGRFVLYSSDSEIAQHFSLAVPIAAQHLAPRYNIAPSQDIPVITEDDRGRCLFLAQWGLVPSWSKEPKLPYSTINAKAETVAAKPAFRSAFKHRRCLIPANGFYEWRIMAQGKQPYYIQRKDQGLFAFAGVWERWDGNDGQTLTTCCLITTTANAIMQPIHDRMPVILATEAYSSWLSGSPASHLLSLLRPYPPEWLTAHPVSTRVNSPRQDGPSLIIAV